MGIYIHGMEMPTSCISCLLNFGEKRPEYGLTIFCPYSDGVISWRDKAFDNGRIASCGIVPVPPHGRLIDADALTETTDGIWDCNDLYFQPNDKICDPNDCKGCKWRETMDCFRRMVKHAPTIIEAEEDCSYHTQNPQQLSLFDYKQTLEERPMLNNEKFIFETEVRTNIHRKGIEDLLSFLHMTDFYEAPASTKYHGAVERGLVKHSLSVYENFWKIAPVFGFTHSKENDESATIVCLFHDICKANFYKTATRNVKNEETGVWEKVPYYTIDEQLPFGSHGAKSLYLVQKYIPLYDDEAMAILHHMGAWDKSNYSDPGKAYSYSILSWLVHVADEASTYVEDN